MCGLKNRIKAEMQRIGYDELAAETNRHGFRLGGILEAGRCGDETLIYVDALFHRPGLFSNWTR
jgi:hypothetical protein